jgi:hypothetical protein
MYCGNTSETRETVGASCIFFKTRETAGVLSSVFTVSLLVSCKEEKDGLPGLSPVEICDALLLLGLGAECGPRQ